jgi:hypothetical protein
MTEFDLPEAPAILLCRDKKWAARCAICYLEHGIWYFEGTRTEFREPTHYCVVTFPADP